MSTELVLKDYNASIRSHAGGLQALVRFLNGYGASVVNHDYSYGVELAVLTIEGPGQDDYDLCYSTPVTDDVIGHLTEDELRAKLAQIENLPAREGFALDSARKALSA